MNPKARVVFDSNIFLSAIIFGGNPRTCLELAREKTIELFISNGILLEIAKKLRGKFNWEESEVKDVIEGIGLFANLVLPEKKINLIKKDPEDNKILECAQEAKANFIISGDKKHLLPISKFKNIPIISSKQFLHIYYQK